MLLLSWEYLVLLLIASMIAIPVVLIGARAWLNNYAYKVGMGVDIFLIPNQFIHRVTCRLSLHLT